MPLRAPGSPCLDCALTKDCGALGNLPALRYTDFSSRKIFGWATCLYVRQKGHNLQSPEVFTIPSLRGVRKCLWGGQGNFLREGIED